MNETLHQAMEAYLEHLKSEGKKDRTLFTYGKDAEQIEAFFGPDKKLSAIQTALVGKFLKSDILPKLPDGKERAERTVQKTVRVFRMFLV
jgi:site-specific recombinase XerC